MQTSDFHQVGFRQTYSPELYCEAHLGGSTQEVEVFGVVNGDDRRITSTKLNTCVTHRHTQGRWTHPWTRNSGQKQTPWVVSCFLLQNLKAVGAEQFGYLPCPPHTSCLIPFLCGSLVELSQQLLPWYPTCLFSLLPPLTITNSVQMLCASFRCNVGLSSIQNNVLQSRFWSLKGIVLKKQSLQGPVREDKKQLNPSSQLSIRRQFCAPAPDSIPTAIFHWEHE